jgi:uncharacterized repeat protein (TIGR01451 family)
MSAILGLWHITANSQTFEKVINSPLLEPIEAFGTAWGDYDNDGDQDLFINILSPSVNNPYGFSRLFQNNCNGEFAHITALPGGITQDTGTSRAASWIDMNNDGNLDLYISHDDGINNSLYINNGDGTFTKETQLNIVNDQAHTRDHAWVDINNDGWLDLFLGNNGGSIPQNDFLYMSNQQGSFNQVTIGDIVNDNARTQGFSFGDYDNDGYLDIFISYNAINKLYHNNGDGTFTPITNTIASLPSISWSSSWIDYDNDLNLDLFIHGNFGSASRLLKNNGDGTFTSLTNDPLVTTIVHNNGGQTWGDYDNDGDLDVFVSDFFKNQLYSNNGNGTFTAVTNEVVTNDSISESFGATWSDFDKDGDLDLLVPNAFGNFPNYFYINTFQNMGNENHWVNIKCIGKQSNNSAIGARIYLKATINGVSKWQMREVNANHSAFHGGQNPLNQHFGLGDATIIDSLKIYWPTSGITQLFPNVTPDRYIEIKEDNNIMNDGKECFADLPPKNPAIITGNVVNDETNDCIGDFPLPNRLIQATPGKFYTLSKDNGSYEFRVPSGNYQIEQTGILNDRFRELDCPTTDTVYNVAAIAGNTTIVSDFVDEIILASCGVSTNIKVGMDLGGQNPCPSSVLPYQACVTYTNNGSAVTNPVSFTINLSPSLGLVISNPTVTDPFGNPINGVFSGSGQTVTFTPVPNTFPANANYTICFDVTVPSSVPPGTLITTDATINGTCGGSPFNQQNSTTTPADCAIDPNDKLSSPQGCGADGNIKKDTTIVYRVRFQNTGTAPAQEVIIRDVLDSDLDITSLHILASSHPITQVEIIPDNALIISYEGINLPDSGSNLQGSNGFVLFSIKPKVNLPDGTTITNQAGIYFDFNEVVLTNTTLNTLREFPEPIADFEAKHSCTNTDLVYDFTYTGGTADNATFFWEFGVDASPQTSSQQNPTGILFSTTGTKQITLIVTRFGCTTTITKEVEVIRSISGDKITICHNGHLIVVNQNAIQAHLNHGDCIGLCDNSNSRLSGNITPVKFSQDEIIFTVFPNPASNVAEIGFTTGIEENISIEVYNYYGQFIRQLYLGKAEADKKINVLFHTQELNNGIYFIKAQTQNEVHIIKLVLTH